MLEQEWQSLISKYVIFIEHQFPYKYLAFTSSLPATSDFSNFSMLAIPKIPSIAHMSAPRGNVRTSCNSSFGSTIASNVNWTISAPFA